MFARFALRKINSAASRLSSWVSNSNASSKSSGNGNKRHSFKARWFGKSALSKLPRNKSVLLAVLLLASSAVALASLGIWRAVRPTPSLAHGAIGSSHANKVAEPPATADLPLTKLREYVYVGGRLITSEEKSCVPTLSPGSASSLQGGGTGSFNVSTPPGCNWSATSGVGWITVTSGASGAGAGAVGYSVAANSGAQRVGTITVNGQAFNITQAPNPATCSYALNKTSETIGVQGGSGALVLTTGGGCPWTASSNAPSWLSVTSPANGIGSATINYSVAANAGGQRIGAITVGGQTFTVTQAPNQASCTFTLSPSSWLYPVEGGTGSFSVATGAGCFWDAATSYGWITITGGATNPTGGGSGTVYFSVQANNGGSRTGSISVRGQVFTITQCGYEISPTSDTATDSGGQGFFWVSAAAGCPWSAVSSESWIGVSPTSGAGNGSVNYSVESYNETNGHRSGTITVAGRTFYIDQFGPPPCQPEDRCDYPYRWDDEICECVCEFCEFAPGGVNPAPDAKPTGLTARYFDNTTLSGQPTLQRIDHVVNFYWAGKSPAKALPASGFGARWSGQLAAPSSEAYTFYLYSDGGARLWVNNQLVIDRWQSSSEPYARSAPVELKADAKADIRVEYYNAGGQATIRLLWSSASTPKQIIPQKYLYPEAATNRSTPTDTNKQSGMMLPPGSDAGPNGARLKPGEWLRIPLGRAGLALLIACGVLALLLKTGWRQARRRFVTAVAYVVSRLRDQFAARLEELFRIVAAAYDKLQFVADFGKRLLSGTFDKLKFAGHFLAAFSPSFKVLSRGGAVMRLAKQKLAGLLPERVRAIARRALSLWRSSGVARLKPVLRRGMVIALIVLLATPLSPAQADGLIRAAQTAWREARAYVGASANRPVDMATVGRSDMVASAAAQAEQVDELQVCPRQLVMFVGERYTLTPVALAVNPIDGSKKVVNGVGMSWSSPNTSVAKVSSFGQVEAMGVGTIAVEVRCGGVSKEITVEVRNGRRDVSSNQQADIDPTNDCSAEQSSMYAPQSVAASAQQLGPIGADGVTTDWDPGFELNSRAAHFRNAVGNPRFTARSQSSAAAPTSTQLGSNSYQFNVPVTSVGGRGVSANIGLTFNSRVWNLDNGKLTFNYVGAYPAPGWTMGYGKIIRNYNGTATGDGSGIGSGNSPGDYLLVSGDGTRKRLAARYDATAGRWFHDSDDGTFLHFDPRSGEMRYPDGSRTIYSSVNGCLLPTAIIGTNGGVITMTYRDYCEGACQRVFRHRTALSAVRDPMGRYVTFHYYGDVGNEYPVDAAQGQPAGELAAIKAPDEDGVQQEVLRVHYQSITLKYNFGGAVVDAPANNSQIQVVRRVYYPRTGTGFLFLDYSSYGMPRKISRRMSMTGAGEAITDGVEIAYTTYNYTTIDPNDPYNRHQGTAPLSDFPQFTRREEWWQGKTDATGAPTTAPTRYDYSRTTDGSTEVTTIEYVDKNCKEVTTTGTDSAQLSFGKVISVERKNSTTGETLSKQVYTYMTGQDGEPEIEKIETFDEAGQGTLVGFGYGHYGRVTDQYEYGYKQAGAYQVRRHTQYDYVDVQSYLDARFLRLVSRVSVYDALNDNNDTNDVLMARTQNTYDDYAAMGGMQSYGLSEGLYPPNHDADYDQNKVMRGNVTAVKTFSSFNPEKATTRGSRFDIFGNVVEVDGSCCVKKIYSLSGLTAYSQPDRVRSGGETGLYLETSYKYNYFTGLVENETNPDGLRTLYEYDRALRIKRVTNQATGAAAETQFQDDLGNDLMTHVSKSIYDDNGTQRIITSKVWGDGAGRAVRAGTGTGDAPNSYDMTATVYDSWGRVVKQSNPYLGDADGNPQAGVTQYWTVTTYDELSRVRKVTMPGAPPDTQFIKTDYFGATETSGATIIATDTVGRQRKSVTDGLGRVVKVTEQNPANGALEWDTIYSYDALDNLTQVNQGGQIRTFIYDAKGRLTSQTTPEAGTTSFIYTDFDAVDTRTDARGVVTKYTYGTLNLLTKVSYNTASAPGVAQTADVTFSYKSASFGKGQIETVIDGWGSESYGYDNVGRLQSRTRVTDGINYETRYEYNAAGQMTLMIYPSGKRVKVGHDARGRLAAMQRVDDSGNPQEPYLNQINYRVDGQVGSQNLGNGTTENYGYSDDRLQLTSQTVTKGGNTLLSLNYGYGASAGQMGNSTTAGNSGQLVSVTGTINGQGRNQEFTYDNVGRLVTATGWGAWARRHDYDRYGNRTAVWDAVSGGNQLENTVIQQAGGMKTNRVATVNGTSFSYDASGDVTGDGVSAFTYDAEKRLVSVSGPSSESYGYDSMNHRVKKVVGGVVTHCVYEGDNMIAEYEMGGGATPATGTRYYHPDHLSTRFITNGAGAVVGTMDHLPFGEEIGGSGERGKRKFTTYEQDGTGLDYAMNRHYNPNRGRFNQADPMGIGASRLESPQSLNLYAYCANDPVNYMDPSGRWAFYAMAAEDYFGGGGGGGFGGGGGGGIPWGIDPDFWGDRIADLPGFGTQWGSFSALAEAQYARNVQDTWDAARATRLINSEDPEEQARGWEIVDSNPNLEVQGKPITSVTVLGKEVGITYEDGISDTDKIKAGNAIAGGAYRINTSEVMLSDDEKKAIGQVNSVSVVKPGSSLGAVRNTMQLSTTYIQSVSEAWLASLFAHEGQHMLNRGKYSGDDRWKDEQNAGTVQLSVGSWVGLSPWEAGGLQNWIKDSNKAQMQEHMVKGYKK